MLTHVDRMSGVEIFFQDANVNMLDLVGSDTENVNDNSLL